MSDLTKPITISEVYMAAASGNLPEGTPLPEPMTRQHEYLKAIAEAMQSYIDISTVKADIEHLQTDKADKSDVYTKTETDNKIIAKVSEIVADAPEDFDTLKEMSDWIASHENSAAEMNSAIQTNKSNIAELQTGKANTEDVYDKTTADSRFLGVNDTADKSVADENGDNIADNFANVKSNVAVNKTTLGTQCKNLLKNTATTKTVNGITFTVNSDKTVTVNGTSNSSTKTDFSIGNFIIGNSELQYIASFGVSSKIENISCVIGYFDENWQWKKMDEDVGGGVVLKKYHNCSIMISINAGATVSNITLYPMIRYADITDETYEPYKPCLQEQIDAIAERLSALEGT